MTECARCGDCCESIWLDSQVGHLLLWAMETGCFPDGSRLDDGNIAFLLDHWHEVERNLTGARYACDQFDAVHRLCVAHDSRPPVCSDFPWYGKPPSSRSISISPRCSYWIDVPREQRPEGTRPLLPMAVAHG